MTEYCTATDVQNRLTIVGYLNVADRDDSGTVEAGELTANITSGIEYASGVVDSYIQGRVNLESARNSGNKWLRDRAIDIAAYRVVSNGGRDEIEAFENDYKQTLEWLERVRDDGDGIPGLSIEQPDFVEGQTYVYHEVSEYIP